MRYLKRKLARYKWYRMARQLRWDFPLALQAALKNLDKLSTRYRCDTIKPDKPSRGNVLLSYFNTIRRDHIPAHIFLSNPGYPIPPCHQAEWRSLQIGRTFLDMGYTVDLISWTNDRFIPYKLYSAFIDVRHNMQRLAPFLNKDCVKIQHIDTAHILAHNAAEAYRLLDLQQRRGITLRPWRWERPNFGIEHADCATINSGDFAISTFQYANKPLYPVPVTSTLLYPSPERKDFEACRRHYLWFGSGGFVHKGLDLVLESFAEMPEYHLTVCGPIQHEKDFERAYYKELYQTANIHTVGWVDVTSPTFLEITNKCLALIYPSSSEGQAGAVVTCMHAGLIPITSHESGVAVNDFGVILKDCSIKEIQTTIRTLSSLPAQELKDMARRAWGYARAHHTRERFAEEYRAAVEHILATHQKQSVSLTSTTPPDRPSHQVTPEIDPRDSRARVEADGKVQGRLLARLTHHLDRSKPYIITREVIRHLEGTVREFDHPWRQVASLQPKGPSKGNVLLSYNIEPFLLPPGQPITHFHTNRWRSWQIAQTFMNLGYSVDVISNNNRTFVPEKDYSVLIDARWSLQRLAPVLNKDCIKIKLIDLCHVLYNNAAEARRLLELQQRKGVTLLPRRFEYPNLAIEHADWALVLGNEFTMSTFRYANKPMSRLPASPPVVYPWPEGKDFDACRRHYVWFGSVGFVRKGLDLVLDAFAEMPDCHLTVCGPINRQDADKIRQPHEEDFEKAYYRELYDTPNIRTIGWVDVSSPRFLEIMNSSIGIIFPSSAEGQVGSVVACLHAALIPIISYECGVDVHDFGLLLKDCSIREIQTTIRTLSSLPAQELRDMALRSWEYARIHHTRERFAEEFRKAIESIVVTHRKPTSLEN